MESFFATLERELLADYNFDNRAQAKTEVFKWIEADYNRRRLHSTLGSLRRVSGEVALPAKACS